MIKNALVIGFGSIGQRHSSILSNLLGSKNLYVLSSQTGLPHKRIKNLQQISELKPDYVVIASNTSSHLEQLEEIEKRLTKKIILVEKPLFSKKSNISLKKNKYLVGYNLRFHPFIKKLKQELKGDKIYAVNMICNSYLPNWRANIPYNKSSSASVKKGGGVLLDLSHELDYLSYLVGSYSHLYSKNLKVSELKINTDDCLFLVGSIKRGGFFSMHLNYFSKNLTRELFIETQTKSIHLDLVNSKLKYYFPKKKPLEKKLKYSIDKTYIDQHKAILSADYKTVCSLKEARNVMNIIDKIQNFKK